MHQGNRPEEFLPGVGGLTTARNPTADTEAVIFTQSLAAAGVVGVRPDHYPVNAMGNSLIYECPVDHHAAGDWRDWSNSILKRIETAGMPREKIEIGSEPIFHYARSPEDSIEYLQNFRVGDGRISIQWWSSIVFYSAFSVTAGSGISTEGLKKSLGGLSLLNESGDCARLENARLFVYHFYARDEYPSLVPALPTIKEKLYIGPGWYVEDEEGSVLRDRYVVYERFPGDVIAFYPERGEPEAGLWRKVSNSDGLIVVEKGSGVWRRLGEEYAEYHDMTLLLGSPEERNAALTVERCHMDDALLCAYNMGPVRDMREQLCMII